MRKMNKRRAGEAGGTARAATPRVSACGRGDTFEAEDVESGETVACDYAAFPDHFGFFLPLAGITTVRQLRESSFDIRATSRLNRLYRTLLEENPDWDAAERRPDMNHFMARLIFCFFAEDTDIFHRSHPFTGTIETMSERGSSNTHEVIGELFRAMNTRKENHEATGIARWARRLVAARSSIRRSRRGLEAHMGRKARASYLEARPNLRRQVSADRRSAGSKRSLWVTTLCRAGTA